MKELIVDTMTDSEKYGLLFELIGGFPKSYFDFPSSLFSYCRSIKGSKISIIKLDDGIIVGRERPSSYSIAYFDCSISNLFKFINYKKDIKKISSIDFTYLDLPMDKFCKYDKNYFAFSGYSFINNNDLSSKGLYNLKREYRIGNDRYTLDFNPNKQEMINVFNIWKEGAALRHFMVFKGHYLKYIEDYFNGIFNNVHIIGFRKDGELFGFSGYEIFDNMAQITLMKHKFEDNSYPSFAWIKTLETILSKDVDVVFCSSTANKLKSRIGLTCYNSYKLKI